MGRCGIAHYCKHGSECSNAFTADDAKALREERKKLVKQRKPLPPTERLERGCEDFVFEHRLERENRSWRKQKD